MNITSKEFNRNPGQVYRAADRGMISGDKVIINHGDYPDRIFELTARERRVHLDDKKGEENEDS